MVPLWGVTLLRVSPEVFAIAMPVLKPAMFVTNGNSRLHWQGEIEKIGDGDPLGPKRGIGAVDEAVPTVDCGENSTPTVLGVVVGAGMLLPVFDVNSTLIGTLRVS